MRTCTTCGEAKPLDEFARDASKKDGLRGKCRACQRAYWRSWRAENAEKHRQTVRDYRQRNPRNPAEGRLRYYGLTEERFIELIAEQGGRCPICLIALDRAATSGPRVPCVDHDHETGKVRGVICRPCNTGLGMFRDEIPTLLRAADYLIGSGTGSLGLEIRTLSGKETADA